jgi:hypothetical protein
MDAKAREARMADAAYVPVPAHQALRLGAVAVDLAVDQGRLGDALAYANVAQAQADVLLAGDPDPLQMVVLMDWLRCVGKLRRAGLWLDKEGH